MKSNKFWEKYGNCLISMLTVLVNIMVMSLLFDFYYDLNDDVMMKDIMAGVYTGTPDGHNMQTLYLLGAFISLCYRLCRNLPWYGLFLFLCQTGCLYLVGVRLLRFCRKRLEKAGCMVLLTLFMWGIVLPHMIAIQYTVTAAILAVTAIFLFMTTQKGLTVRAFVVRNIPSIVLVILAYQLRTEMLLLLFPLICMAGLFRWAEEEKFFSRENYFKYGIVIGCILAGMLLSRLVDFAAYGSEEWKKFLTFFDNRTEVYDYHYDILVSGEHKEYLASIGLNDAQQELLANYNFGLDEEIDENILGRIAAYAAEQTTDAAVSEEVRFGHFSVKLREHMLKQGKLYFYRILHAADAPYSLLVFCGYFVVACSGIWLAVTDRMGKRRWSFIWELILLGIVRFVLWMYILMGGRYPERITHPLYLAEFMLLMGIFCIQLWQSEHRIVIPAVLGAMMGVICLCYLPYTISAVSADEKAREEINRNCLAIAEYGKEHPENFYFEDVYSTVGFSQKIFKNVDNSLANYDIMGGWMCKSPLYREKLAQFGIATMEEGLLQDDAVYFIMETGTPDSSTDWIQAYYAKKGVEVGIEQVDMIGNGYAVIQLSPK